MCYQLLLSPVPLTQVPQNSAYMTMLVMQARLLCVDEIVFGIFILRLDQQWRERKLSWKCMRAEGHWSAEEDRTEIRTDDKWKRGA